GHALERPLDAAAALVQSVERRGNQIELLAALDFVHRIAHALGLEIARAGSVGVERVPLGPQTPRQGIEGAGRYQGSSGSLDARAHSVTGGASLSRFRRVLFRTFGTPSPSPRSWATVERRGA